MTPALTIEDVHVTFPGAKGDVPIVNGVTLQVEAGQTLGLVGESGSGKSMTLRSMSGLIPKPGRLTSGIVTIGGKTCVTVEDFAETRGTEVTMIFQDPASTLNPVRTIGDQISEVLRVKMRQSRSAAKSHAIELLARVGIPDPQRRHRSYPHELSGGMRQRVMIALAIATEPTVLLADEPTSALDVTTQEQILELLDELQRETSMAMVLVTHDLGVVAQMCHQVATLYAGYVVERGDVDVVLQSPQHPYTRALMAAMPTLSTSTAPVPIEGGPPDPAELPLGCPFGPRCTLVRPGCDAVNMLAEEKTSCACPYERHR